MRVLGFSGQFELFDGLKAIPPYDEDDDVGNGPAVVVALNGTGGR